jgi:sulfoxide reductase heme-binding subunit YedZ
VLATNSQALWYLTRGTGVISLVLLTASVALGVSEVVRFATPGWPRFVLAALHKNVALLATAFVAVHVLTAVLDSFASISFADVLVPFVGNYRPLWLGLGTVAFDLLLALIVTSLLRERIGYRAWRVVHWSAYACWPVAFLHSLGTGSDTRYQWAAAVNVACLVAVLLAVLFRIGWTRTVPIVRRSVATLGSAALALGIVAWMIVEPMRPGWARKAGTPSALLASTSNGTPTRADAAIPVPFSSTVQGSISQTGDDGRSSIAIDAVLAGAGNARLHVEITGAPLEGGGVEMERGTVRLGVDGAPDLYRGDISQLSGTSIAATAQSRSGTRISLDMHLTIDDANNVGGTASAVLGGSSGN